MKYVIILLSILTFTAPPKKEKELISIIHIGASDKPLYPIIISKDSVEDKVTLEFVKDSIRTYGNAKNYIVNGETYNDLKTLLVDYKKKGAFEHEWKDHIDYEFIIYVKGSPNLQYYLKYKKSMKLLKLLVKISKSDPNNESLSNGLEGAILYYDNY